jgi:hypothetical protein
VIEWQEKTLHQEVIPDRMRPPVRERFGSFTSCLVHRVQSDATYRTLTLLEMPQREPRKQNRFR